VTLLDVGNVVGCGPQRGSCGACEFCGSGEDSACGKMEGLYDPKYGGYATSITVNERFAFKVPDGKWAGGWCQWLHCICGWHACLAPAARRVGARV
jgi:D-arabinose 1-dehydrogenase-like Zn-dependent alcohol dehydrogenase